MRKNGVCDDIPNTHRIAVFSSWFKLLGVRFAYRVYIECLCIDKLDPRRGGWKPLGEKKTVDLAVNMHNHHSVQVEHFQYILVLMATVRFQPTGHLGHLLQAD